MKLDYPFSEVLIWPLLFGMKNLKFTVSTKEVRGVPRNRTNTAPKLRKVSNNVPVRLSSSFNLKENVPSAQSDIDPTQHRSDGLYS
jgi:hypothetical protein